MRAEVEDGPLLGEITALETASRWFAGEQIPFAELVRPSEAQTVAG